MRGAPGPSVQMRRIRDVGVKEISGDWIGTSGAADLLPEEALVGGYIRESSLKEWARSIGAFSERTGEAGSNQSALSRWGGVPSGGSRYAARARLCSPPSLER
ncbi:hypothetical protein AAFF_G00286180 [Aldrovandia affinis]|uniref:Uncharacterized protein n=1 Tax=Aldrovandia affinis TaxID=143900 RepID=A0AAD7TAH3_9TELE|nr:hypothetical protein AAFF_G00286180 [Aldrovandia affinis]